MKTGSKRFELFENPLQKVGILGSSSGSWLVTKLEINYRLIKTDNITTAMGEKTPFITYEIISNCLRCDNVISTRLKQLHFWLPDNNEGYNRKTGSKRFKLLGRQSLKVSLLEPLSSSSRKLTATDGLQIKGTTRTMNS